MESQSARDVVARGGQIPVTLIIHELGRITLSARSSQLSPLFHSGPSESVLESLEETDHVGILQSGPGQRWSEAARSRHTSLSNLSPCP